MSDFWSSWRQYNDVFFPVKFFFAEQRLDLVSPFIPAPDLLYPFTRPFLSFYWPLSPNNAFSIFSYSTSGYSNSTIAICLIYVPMDTRFFQLRLSEFPLFFDACSLFDTIRALQDNNPFSLSSVIMMQTYQQPEGADNCYTQLSYI